jgi:hypothetical protein
MDLIIPNRAIFGQFRTSFSLILKGPNYTVSENKIIILAFMDSIDIILLGNRKIIVLNPVRLSVRMLKLGYKSSFLSNNLGQI